MIFKLKIQELIPMKKIVAILALIVGVTSICKASDITYAKSIVNTVLTSTQNFDVDMDSNNVDLASIQVNMSSASPTQFGNVNSTVTFTDGTPSTATITVAEGVNGISTAAATNVIYISSGAGAIGATLTINVGGGDYPAKDGSAWNSSLVSTNSAIVFTTGTAVSICNYLNTNYSTYFLSTVTAAGNVIVSTTVTKGFAQNLWYITSSTQAAMSSSATFSGGVDNAVVKLNGYTLTANTQYQVVTYSSGTIQSTNTATNIATAISSSSFGGGFLVAQALKNVVTSTSLVSGLMANYQIGSSTTGLLVSSPTFANGTDSDLTWTIPSRSTGPAWGPNVGNYSGVYPIGSTKPLNSIGKATSQFGIGLPILFTKSSGTVPSPLVDKTTYYVTALTPSSFKLAVTSTDAFAGNAITITTVSFGGNGSFNISAIPLSTGAITWALYRSNDAINFQPVFVSSGASLTPFQVIVTTANPNTVVANTNVLYDLGVVSYRWLRFAFINGTWGGMNFNVVLNGEAYGKSSR